MRAWHWMQNCLLSVSHRLHGTRFTIRSAPSWKSSVEMMTPSWKKCGFNLGCNSNQFDEWGTVDYYTCRGIKKNKWRPWVLITCNNGIDECKCTFMMRNGVFLFCTVPIKANKPNKKRQVGSSLFWRMWHNVQINRAILFSLTTNLSRHDVLHRLKCLLNFIFFTIMM